jgi:broad specificity phosphatase PhoE
VHGAAPGSTLVVVSHQLVLGALLCELTETPLSGWNRWAHRNTAWSELAWEVPPRVVAHDQAPHLDGT